MSNADLLKWTTSDVDFYELLGITFENCSESELRRAYRKTALKYHPDKVGKDFDPDKYELFQAANDVLSDAELKAKYDNHRQAKLQKQRANELFEGKRRQMKEELEARERAGATGATAAGVKRPWTDDEDMKKMAELGRQKRPPHETIRQENQQERLQKRMKLSGWNVSFGKPRPRKQSGRLRRRQERVASSFLPVRLLYRAKREDLRSQKVPRWLGYPPPQHP
jgi:curved DNA-binding protein CbpA